jgi:hypothetical protein
MGQHRRSAERRGPNRPVNGDTTPCPECGGAMEFNERFRFDRQMVPAWVWREPGLPDEAAPRAADRSPARPDVQGSGADVEGPARTGFAHCHEVRGTCRTQPNTSDVMSTEDYGESIRHNSHYLRGVAKESVARAIDTTMAATEMVARTTRHLQWLFQTPPSLAAGTRRRDARNAIDHPTR